MKLRDKLNTEQGYLEIIQNNFEYIDEDKSTIKERLNDEKNGIHKYPRTNLEIIQLIEEGISDKYFEILLAKYSKGDPVAEVLQCFHNIIPTFIKFWKKSNGYVEMLEMLSIGIMLEINDKDFGLLVETVKKDDPQDLLIDTLISYRDKSWVQLSNKLMWNKPYKALQDVINLAKEDKDLSLERLRIYLKKEWFKGAVEIQTHKSKYNIHSGYWSFESGALVKILKLDDTVLKDKQFYPYNMVHCKE